MWQRHACIQMFKHYKHIIQTIIQAIPCNHVHIHSYVHIRSSVLYIVVQLTFEQLNGYRNCNRLLEFGTEFRVSEWPANGALEHQTKGSLSEMILHYNLTSVNLEQIIMMSLRMSVFLVNLYL